MTKTNNALGGFSFDDENVDFFGIGATTKDNTDVSTVVKNVKTEKTVVTDENDEDEGEVTPITDDKGKVTTKASKKEDDEDDQQEEFSFEAPSDTKKPKEKTTEKVTTTKEEDKPEEEDGNDEGDGTEEEDEEEIYTGLALDLVDEGIFQNVELPKDKKLNKEQFFEHLDTEVEARVDDAVKGLFEDMDDDAKEFIKFKKNGGKTQDFLKTYTAPAATLPKEFDEENKKIVDNVLKVYLTTVRGIDEEDLDDQIELLKEKGKDVSSAKKWHKEMIDAQAAAKEALTAKAEKAKLKEENDAKAFTDSIKTLLTSSDKLGDFPLSKKEADDLHKFMTVPTVRVGKNKFVPQFQVELHKVLLAGTKEDKEKFALLGKLIKSNFDFSDIKAAAETKVAKNVRTNLVRAKTGIRAKSSGGVQRRELADLID